MQIKADGSEAQKELTVATVDHQKVRSKFRRCTRSVTLAMAPRQPEISFEPSFRSSRGYGAQPAGEGLSQCTNPLPGCRFKEQKLPAVGSRGLGSWPCCVLYTVLRANGTSFCV